MEITHMGLKRILGAVLLVAALWSPAEAQISQDLGVTIGGAEPYVLIVHPGYIRIQYATVFNASSTSWVEVWPYGISQYALSTTFRGSPSALTTALQCSTDGTTVGSTIATSTATTADTQTGTASCRFVRVTTSGLTGSSAIDIVVTGASAVAGSAVTVTGSVDTELPAAVLYANNIAYPTSPVVNVALLCDDGATLDKCAAATGGAGAVDANTTRVSIATDDDVSDAATLLEANITLAHDDVDAGNPLKIGGAAVSFGATPTAVAAADRTRFIGTRAGVVFTQPGHPNTISTECQVQDADGALTDQACVTVAAGTKIVVTGATISCDGSTTAPTNIAVGFGTANVPARAHTGTAGIIIAMDGVPAGGGKVKGYSGGIVAVGADDEDIRYTIEDPAGGNCSIEVSYYTIAG